MSGDPLDRPPWSEPIEVRHPGGRAIGLAFVAGLSLGSWALIWFVGARYASAALGWGG